MAAISNKESAAEDASRRVSRTEAETGGEPMKTSFFFLGGVREAAEVEKTAVEDEMEGVAWQQKRRSIHDDDDKWCIFPASSDGCKSVQYPSPG